MLLSDSFKKAKNCCWLSAMKFLKNCVQDNLATPSLINISVSCSVMSDSMTPWTVTCQAPLSMEFSRQEYCSGLPFPIPGDLPNPGIKPGSPAL